MGEPGREILRRFGWGPVIVDYMPMTEQCAVHLAFMRAPLTFSGRIEDMAMLRDILDQAIQYDAAMTAKREAEGDG